MILLAAKVVTRGCCDNEQKSCVCFLSTDRVFLVPSELKDNLGNDEPEGDMPVLLQTLLSRNPKIFRDKSRWKHTATVSGKDETC